MLAKSSVIFNDITHEYSLNGKTLSGITTLLHRQLFPNKYVGIDEAILQRAADYGSLVHEQIELYDSLGGNDDNDIIKEYIKIKDAHNLKTLANEYLVSDNEYVASSIDIVFEDFSLCDIKTTSHLDEVYVSWQLSIYAYLFELQNPTLKVNKLYALWLPKPQYGRPKLVEVQRKPSEWVIDLIDADKNGLQYNSPATQTQAIALPNDVVHQVIMIEQQLKEMQETRKELQQGLLELMKLHNIKSFKADGLSLSYKGESIRTGIDTKKLKDLYPDIYEECLTQSIVKESIIIKTT